jgi:squalene-hopene/tetraprenyl-beta-curcumene cyclase
VLIALRTIKRLPECASKAASWLCRIQNADGGWGGDRNVGSSIEETALAVSALSLCGEVQAAKRGGEWLAQHTHGGAETPVSPIGFYFAKLWYFERLYPLIFAVDAMSRVEKVTRTAP